MASNTDNANNAEEIFKRFPTERYKRFWYPTRPLFTLFTGLFIAGLGVLGLLPFSWTLWFAAAFALDDLPITPISAMFTAINNLIQGRKTLKSMVMITAISLAVITGGLLGYFVLAQSPIAVKLIMDYIVLTACSPLFISLGAMLGAFVAHATHKINPFMGFSLGISIASLIPFSPPLIFEIIFLSIAGCTFLTSMLAKQGLRAYFKYTYGDSNADGHACARSPEDQAAFVASQAAKFKVTPEAFQNLVSHCKEKFTTYKQQASFLHEFSGNRNYVTNSFKDIYLGLMNPKLTDTEAVTVKELIANSRLDDVNNNQETKIRIETHFVLGTFFHAGVSERTLGHQIKIAEGGGLDSDKISPFLEMN
jgi:hypothetical protein